MFEKMVFEDADVEEEAPAGAVVTKNVCNSCGGSFCTYINTKADFCVFCGSKSISSEDYVEAKNFSYIPFIKGINDAKDIFKKKTFWNPLVPFSFKFRKNKPTIQKAFLPTVLVNANQNGTVVFLGGEKQKIVKDRKKCTELKKYEVVQTINVDYNQVLLNSSTKINDKVFMNVCNYDFDHLQRFDVETMKDTCYLIGDIPASEVGNAGRGSFIKHTLAMTRDNVGHTLKKLKEDQTVFSFHDAQEVLVPVYILNIPYGKKNYQFLMNGENGKCYFELPIGVWSTILFSIIVCGIVFAIAYYVSLYF